MFNSVPKKLIIITNMSNICNNNNSSVSDVGTRTEMSSDSDNGIGVSAGATYISNNASGESGLASLAHMTTVTATSTAALSTRNDNTSTPRQSTKKSMRKSPRLISSPIVDGKRKRTAVALYSPGIDSVSQSHASPTRRRTRPKRSPTLKNGTFRPRQSLVKNLRTINCVLKLP
jgi:hypothetical protein